MLPGHLFDSDDYRRVQGCWSDGEARHRDQDSGTERQCAGTLIPEDAMYWEFQAEARKTYARQQ